jgi:hypothetical protein
MIVILGPDLNVLNQDTGTNTNGKIYKEPIIQNPIQFLTGLVSVSKHVQELT